MLNWLSGICKVCHKKLYRADGDKVINIVEKSCERLSYLCAFTGSYPMICVSCSIPEGFTTYHFIEGYPGVVKDDGEEI